MGRGILFSSLCRRPGMPPLILDINFPPVFSREAEYGVGKGECPSSPAVPDTLFLPRGETERSGHTEPPYLTSLAPTPGGVPGPVLTAFPSPAPQPLVRHRLTQKARERLLQPSPARPESGTGG